MTQGGWHCPNTSCKNSQGKGVFSHHAVCPLCGMGKSTGWGPSSNGTDLDSFLGAQYGGEQSGGSWFCPSSSCKNSQGLGVFPQHARCPLCGAGKSQHGAQQFDAAVSGQRDGSGDRGDNWLCPNSSCKNAEGRGVFGQHKMCPVCGHAKPLNAIIVSPKGTGKGGDTMGGNWMCPTAGCKNSAGKGVFPHNSNCPMCGSCRPQGGFGDADNWHCPNTACKNAQGKGVFGQKPTCPLCDTARPGKGGKGGKGGKVGNGGKGVRPDDSWLCPNDGCKNHTRPGVWGQRESCPLCGLQKPDAADLVMAGDDSWHCHNSSCKNSQGRGVFGQHSNCPMCGEGKPIAVGGSFPGARFAPY